jgi:uncharacterized protein YqgV (UPF0045/DUF77 family)
MDVRAEFTVYPWIEGEASLPAHTEAAVTELRRAGLEVSLGPFGQRVTGEAKLVFQALRAAEDAAFAAGAEKLVLVIEVTGD